MPQEPLELDVEGELRLKSRGGETEAVAPAPSASKLEQIHEESEKQSLPEQENVFTVAKRVRPRLAKHYSMRLQTSRRPRRDVFARSKQNLFPPGVFPFR
jgi:hypothetical protein